MVLPSRHSIRLQNYNYSSNGAYFVTICTQDRQLLFGSVGVDLCVDPSPNMQLNDVGKMVNNWWLKIPNKFPDIDLDVFQIMPNHIHGIIFINESGGRTHRSAPTLGTIIQWFKTMTTNDYMKNVKKLGWEPFNGRIFQRNYFEHVIRNEKDLDKISWYIENNPQMWNEDQDNPKS